MGDNARMLIAVAQEPGLADGAIPGQRRAEQVGQAPPAPQPVLKDRFKEQGIQCPRAHRARLFVSGVGAAMRRSDITAGLPPTVRWPTEGGAQVVHRTHRAVRYGAQKALTHECSMVV